MTSSKAVALRMILAAKAPAIPFKKIRAGEARHGEAFHEVLDGLVPGSSDLCQVCITLAHLAADRWTDDEVLDALTVELDSVQKLYAIVRFEELHGRAWKEGDDLDDEGE